jgi:pilus assembly protein CpaB
MNRRLTSILLSAFLLAAGCSYLVYRLVVGRLAAGAPSKTTHVIAANADIKLGSVLRDADLTTVEMAGTLPKGVIVKREDAIGRGVISDLHQGEPILDSRLAAVGSGGGLAATIPPGMRACAVKVDDVVGVAGFATPGMRVDVLISGVPPGAVNTDQGPKVATLLQNIEVLSAGTDIQKDAEGKPKPVQVVNLLVTPEQAESLSLASNQTKIQLVLRNPLDTQISQPPGIIMANLFGDRNAPPKSSGARPSAPSASPRVYVIQVLNGSKKTEQKFSSGEEKQ